MSQKKKTPKVDSEELKKLAEKNPSSVQWNNPNSRNNLKQYKSDSIIPEIISTDDEDDSEVQKQVDQITQGRKLDPALVKTLIPKRNVLTPAEKQRYTGIVTTFLSDFKNEDPTASDVDDILEIAKCDTMETRLLEASKTDPATLVAVSQSMDRIYKRKQTAKENLANRRSDRKGVHSSHDVTVVDLVVAFEKHNSELERQRIEKLLEQHETVSTRLHELIEEEEF